MNPLWLSFLLAWLKNHTINRPPNIPPFGPPPGSRNIPNFYPGAPWNQWKPSEIPPVPSQFINPPFKGLPTKDFIS